VAGFDTMNARGELDVPPGLDDVVQVAVGQGAVLALRRDGTVVGWGKGPEAAVPPGLAHVKQIVADGLSAVALLDDTSLVSWPPASAVPVPAGPTGLARVYLIASELLGIDASGTVRMVYSPTPNNYPLRKVTSITSLSTFFGIVDGRLTVIRDRNALLPTGYRHFRELAALPGRLEGDGSRTLFGALALTNDGQVIAWDARATPEQGPLSLSPNAAALPLTHLDSVVRLYDNAAIRGDEEHAAAYVVRGPGVLEVLR
jgi:hypothetical protein